MSLQTNFAVHLSISAVNKRFASTGDVLSDIDVDVPGGQFITLLGPSGCGKSTFLRLLAGLESPDTGSLRFDDRDLATRTSLGYVFQEPRLLPWRTAAANIALPLEIEDGARENHTQLVNDALKLVRLEAFAKSFPDELSGGMRMRVSVARALVTSPRLLLLDEPFGALDEMTRQDLNDELMRLWLERNWTAVFVTHNVFEAVYLSQRILIMSAKPGKIVADIEVPFDYPREAQLRAQPEFAAVVGRVMGRLTDAS